MSTSLGYGLETIMILAGKFDRVLIYSYIIPRSYHTVLSTFRLEASILMLEYQSVSIFPDRIQ